MTKSTFTQIFHPAAVLALMTGTAPAALANDVSPQALPAPVPAQLVEDIGAAERIDVADRLRTLTQLIPASACHLHGGVLADEARQMLTVAHDTFTVLTDALLDGDESLNIIGAEQRPKTIAEIEAINVAWKPTDDAVMRLLADANDTEALAVIKDTNGPLFDKASHLLSELEGEYTNPTELLLVDMLLIEIAGRQSMLTQKMSKEVCTIWSGNTSDTAVKALQGTIAMFDFSMKALINGAPNLGVKAAPTPEIKAALEDVMSDWDSLRAEIEGVFADGTLPEEVKAKVFHDLNVKMEKIDEIIHKYVVFSKHKYS